ncbi:endonuclease III [Thermodesulfatator indicus DSM 15286]|uniref:Endonuclease III n=1 Tax=Thermodesulfatator indicus (strain DSM 15286 / JCM 11887 / CIR29812) TaxID=667014 RepID=F8AD93_THEID|nr:endonuclease III [Thermodesulfatator indicus]AEH44827.1 endonuclease III [Thermodesulfatator indicus DSM 15286]
MAPKNKYQPPKLSEQEKKRLNEILRRLKEAYPEVKIALKFSNPLELLVATILSAQCTDERVNQVTAELFKKYRSAKDYAEAPLEELAEDIRSTGFYQQKAKYIKECARLIIEKFGGEVPRSMEDMLKLPGVARKTANIVLSNAYGVVEGIPVDTHVRRLAQRLGFTKEKKPDKIEQDLMAIIPREEWGQIAYVFQAHGRKICKARKPLCDQCVVKDLCPSKKES